MTKNNLLSILVLIIFHLAPQLKAQQLDHKQGEVILCLHPQSNISDVSKRHASMGTVPTGFVIERCLSGHMNIWKGKFDYTVINENQMIDQLNADSEIVVAQLNHILKRRSILPNDPQLNDQWQWINTGERGLADADIDADEAWSMTTGGVTQLGDTIVVAVLDVGVYDRHEDLSANIWRNYQEIPGNGLDDDENGYVDDYRGWNVLFTNDSIDPEVFGGGIEESHGTEILGVIGAVGNNGIGVSGINWHVKLMNVYFNSDLNEADMIAAYGYVLDQRKLYNETSGAKGAFVVATNLSYGDEDLTPEETPIWCAVYDSLGSQGILNCTATANTSIDIDSIRDVPTSCASQYMISVTATNDSDVRSFAAYGKNDIDLAAPGSQLYTTSIPEYDFVTGTSFASPMVAGAIGLLYSSPCGDLAALARINPEEAALNARALILEEVDPIVALEEEVASGGRLNIFNSLSKLMAECQSCVAPFEVQTTADRDPTTIQIAWQIADSVANVNFNWRISGDTIWQSMDSVISPLSLQNLMVCQDYEFMLTAICQDGTQAATNILNFNTGGCCLPPSNIQIASRTDTTLRVTYDGSMAAVGYFAIIGEISDSIIWDTSVINQGESSMTFEGLAPCTNYYFLLQTICDGSDGVTSSDTMSARTMGCGACLDSTYCTLPVNAVGDEWIESVSLNTIDVNSGYDGGYGDYTGNSTPLKQGNGYTLSIEPGYAADTLEEYYYAWIDYNQNGNFDDDGEQIFASDTAITGTLETIIRIPEDAPIGLTRLRVMMLFDPVEDTVSGCTTNIDLGEAEDYCVEIIIDSLLCPKPVGLDTMDYQGTSTLIIWEEVDSAIAYVVRSRKVGDEEWMEEVVDTMNSFSLEEMENCESYEVQVQAVCSRDTSGYTESFIVAAPCNTAVDDLNLHLQVDIFPNPFDQVLSLEIHTDESQLLDIELLHLDGKIVSQQRKNIIPGRQLIKIEDVESLPSGMYLISLKNKNGRLVRKVLHR